MPAMRSMVMVRSLSVRAYVGRPADRPQGGIEAGEQRPERAVPGGDDHPEAAPREPGAEQEGGPAADVIGPAPQSNWSHMPGSVTHGR